MKSVRDRKIKMFKKIYNYFKGKACKNKPYTEIEWNSKILTMGTFSRQLLTT